MTKDQESTSSIKTASSRPPEEVIDLGKRLAKELELDRSCETLSKWIAHVLAEKISAMEEAIDTEDKMKLERQVVGLTLQIWQKRYYTPPRIRPFGRLEKAAEFLANLADQISPPSSIRHRKTEDTPWEDFLGTVDAFYRQAFPILVLTKALHEQGNRTLSR